MGKYANIHEKILSSSESLTISWKSAIITAARRFGYKRGR
jgi:hypothetical protein